MEKFLFTDGKHGVKEVTGEEEFQALLAEVENTASVRIWLYNSCEWITYASFIRQFPSYIKKEKPRSLARTSSPVPIVDAEGTELSYSYMTMPGKKKKNPAQRILYILILGSIAFFVFNFTRVNWKSDTPLNVTASRPANVPVMNIDSLITEIENTRGQSLDRSTKGNLRLRNTWPDLVQLQLVADRESSSAGNRFSNVDISIDNSTGLLIDNAVVKLSVWKNKKIVLADTVQFSNISYDKKTRRELDYRYKGDSLSVSFESIRARSFNFAYNSSTRNNAGDYNDRWFSK